MTSASLERLLHPDIFYQITAQLDPQAIFALALTSQRIHRLVTRNVVWRPHCTSFIEKHCRPQESCAPIRLVAFDGRPDASWWRVWRDLLMAHHELFGFWALDAPVHGRLMAVRISPTTGSITCEILQRCTTSPAAVQEFARMHHHSRELPGGLLQTAGLELAYFCFRAETDFTQELLSLHDPSVEVSLVFQIKLDTSTVRVSGQHVVTYWRDAPVDPPEEQGQLRARIKHLQAYMTDIPPLIPRSATISSQTIQLRPELAPKRKGWHKMSPDIPRNDRRRDRVIKSLDFGFEPGALHLGKYRQSGMKTQYELGHHRPIYCPMDMLEAVEAFDGAPLAALAGLWIGSYSTHGPEVIYFRPLSQSPIAALEDEPRHVVMEAIKVTGDPNVPCGEITFQIFDPDMAPTDIPLLRRPLNMPPWPLRGPENQSMGPVYVGRGRIAAPGFVDPAWAECRLGVMNIDQVTVEWTELMAITVFTRLTGL